jgi:hypothetical protein
MKTVDQQAQEILNERLSHEETIAKIDKAMLSRGDDSGCKKVYSEEQNGNLVCTDQQPQKRTILTFSACTDPDDNRRLEGPWHC